MDINAPDGVKVTVGTDAAGIATSLKIAVDYAYADFTNPKSGAIEEINFVGPTTNPPATAPTPGAQFPGLRLPFELDITNQLGVPITGYSVYLANQNLLNKPAPPVPDTGDAHPDNYAHFHGVTPTTFVDAATNVSNVTLTLFDPNFGSAAFGAAGNDPAPNFISAVGTIAAGTTEKAAGLTLHSEDFPDAAGGSFGLEIFAQDTVGVPKPPVVTPPVTPPVVTPPVVTPPVTPPVVTPPVVTPPVTPPVVTPPVTPPIVEPPVTPPVVRPPVVTPPLGPHDIALTGSHDQYIVALTSSGQAEIRDKIAGRDGTQTISGLQHMKFTDGTGDFDPTGQAETVTRLYQAAFSRTPDLAGLDHNAELLTNNTISISQMALSFTNSPEFIASYGSLDNLGFVQQLYANVLHRAPDAAGNQLWLNFLSGGADRGAALRGFADSQENRKQILPIAGDQNDAEGTRLYQAALNRAPDDSGLASFSTALAHGATPEQVAHGFMSSNEFVQKYGTLNPSDFVTQLYANVLHRAPDAAGLQNFVNALNNGASREQVLVGFSDSTENRINTALVTHDAWVFIK